MPSTQVEMKCGWQQEKYFLAEEKELKNLNKNVTLLLLFITTLLLNSFCCIFQPSFIKTSCLFRVQGSCFTKKIGFIFNNCSSFVNPSQHLIFCGDGVYVCKIKKNVVSCHAVAEELFVEWLPKELWQLYIELRWLETVFLQEEFCQWKVTVQSHNQKLYFKNC